MFVVLALSLLISNEGVERMNNHFSPNIGKF